MSGLLRDQKIMGNSKILIWWSTFNPKLSKINRPDRKTSKSTKTERKKNQHSILKRSLTSKYLFFIFPHFICYFDSLNLNSRVFSSSGLKQNSSNFSNIGSIFVSLKRKIHYINIGSNQVEITRSTSCICPYLFTFIDLWW